MKKIQFLVAVLTFFLVLAFTVHGLRTGKQYREEQKIELGNLRVEVNNLRCALQALSRTNWYYVDTSTNFITVVSAEPNGGGEKMAFPLPAGYRSWLNKPMSVERAASEGRLPVAVGFDELKGKRFRFAVANRPNDLTSTFDGLLVVDIVY